MKKLILVVAALGLVACEPSPVPIQRSASYRRYDLPGVFMTVWRDPELRVICYYIYNGVSCLPDSQIEPRENTLPPATHDHCQHPRQ